MWLDEWLDPEWVELVWLLVECEEPDEAWLGVLDFEEEPLPDDGWPPWPPASTVPGVIARSAARTAAAIRPMNSPSGRDASILPR